MRTAILGGAMAFVVIFAALTLTVAFESGFDIFTLASIAILALLGMGVYGALNEPPDDR